MPNFGDYTVDAKATKSVIAGDFPRGLSVAPEEHSPVTFVTKPIVAELDSKIKWYVTPYGLKEFGAGALGMPPDGVAC